MRLFYCVFQQLFSIDFVFGANGDTNATDGASADMFIGVFHMFGAFFGVKDGISFRSGGIFLAGDGVCGASDLAKGARAAFLFHGWEIGGKGFVHQNGGEAHHTAVLAVNEERGFADIAEIGFRCGGFMGKRAGKGIVYGRLACRDHERPMSLPFQFERGKERKLVEGEVYRTVMVKILIGGGFFAVHLFHDGVE